VQASQKDLILQQMQEIDWMYYQFPELRQLLLVGGQKDLASDLVPKAAQVIL
jgi:hypothetical protein